MSGHPSGPRRKGEPHLELVTTTPRKDAEIVVTRADETGDPFLAFESEAEPRPTKAPAVSAAASRAAAAPKPSAGSRKRGKATRMLLIALGALMIAAAAAAATYAYLELTRPGPTTNPIGTSARIAPSGSGPATLNITSQPEGARVLIDGTPRGETPLRLSLPAGAYVIDIEHHDARRSTPVTLEAGAAASHYFDFAAAAPETGRLDVTSDPSGATVTIDGTLRGLTPLVIPSIPPGSHRVVVSNRDMSSTHNITVAAGATATLGVVIVR